MKAQALAISFALIPAAAMADSEYVAVVGVLDTRGGFSQDIIASTANGVSLDECESRKSAWLKENGAAFEAIIADMRKQGKSAELSVKCRRK